MLWFYRGGGEGLLEGEIGVFGIFGEDEEEGEGRNEAVTLTRLMQVVVYNTVQLVARNVYLLANRPAIYLQ